MLVFDWDAENAAHIERHGVSVSEAEEAIRGNPIEAFAYAKDGEARFGFIGPTEAGRLLFVVVTLRGETTRVVTAYAARRSHRKLYLQETQ